MPTRICRNCGLSKDIDTFRPIRGNKLTVSCNACRRHMQSHTRASQRSTEAIRTAVELGSPIASSLSQASRVDALGTPVADSSPLAPRPTPPRLGTPLADSSPLSPSPTRKRTATLTPLLPRPQVSRLPVPSRAPWREQVHEDPSMQRAHNRRLAQSREHRIQRRGGDEPSPSQSSSAFLSSAESIAIGFIFAFFGAAVFFGPCKFDSGWQGWARKSKFSFVRIGHLNHTKIGG